MRGVVQEDVVEALAEFLDFVGSEVPVAGLPRQPELGVPHLLQRHDFAEAWRVRLGPRRAATRGTKSDQHRAGKSSLRHTSYLGGGDAAAR